MPKKNAVPALTIDPADGWDAWFDLYGDASVRELREIRPTFHKLTDGELAIIEQLADRLEQGGYRTLFAVPAEDRTAYLAAIVEPGTTGTNQPSEGESAMSAVGSDVLDEDEIAALDKHGHLTANELRVRDPRTPRRVQEWLELVADRLDAGGWMSMARAPLSAHKALVRRDRPTTEAIEAGAAEARAVIAVYGHLTLRELEELSKSPHLSDALCTEMTGWARRLRYTRFDKLADLPEGFFRETVIRGLG